VGDTVLDASAKRHNVIRSALPNLAEELNAMLEKLVVFRGLEVDARGGDPGRVDASLRVKSFNLVP
jgi:hypothetical protein